MVFKANSNQKSNILENRINKAFLGKDLENKLKLKFDFDINTKSKNDNNNKNSIAISLQMFKSPKKK